MVHRVDRPGAAAGAVTGAEVVIDHRRISWSAIIAGAVLALVIGFLLNLLGVGIGLSTIEPSTAGTPDIQSLGMGAVIWWIVSGLIAMFIGGFAAARMAGVWEHGDAVLHGLITWGVATLVSFYLLTTALGGLMGGAYGALSSATSAVGQGLSSAAGAAGGMAGNMQAPPRGQVLQVVDQMLSRVAPNADPQQIRQAREQLAGLVPQMLQGGEPAEQARRQAANIVGGVAGVPPEQAMRQLNDQFQQLQQRAAEAADAAAGALSSAAIWSFVALLLGAVATGLGSYAGTRSRQDQEYPGGLGRTAA